MTDHNKCSPVTWEVEVRVNGETHLTLGHNHLAGDPNVNEDIVEKCALHLLSFIGRAIPAVAAEASEPVAWQRCGGKDRLWFNLPENITPEQLQGWRTDGWMIRPLYVAPAQRPVTYVKTLEDLVQCLIDNDPEDLAADGGIRVIDVWRKDAERTLALSRPHQRQEES